jgi:hypothetical protein
MGDFDGRQDFGLKWEVRGRVRPPGRRDRYGHRTDQDERPEEDRGGERPVQTRTRVGGARRGEILAPGTDLAATRQSSAPTADARARRISPARTQRPHRGRRHRRRARARRAGAAVPAAAPATRARCPWTSTPLRPTYRATPRPGDPPTRGTAGDDCGWPGGVKGAMPRIPTWSSARPARCSAVPE